MIRCPNLIFQNIVFVFNTIAWKNGEFQEAGTSVSAELKKKSVKQFVLSRSSYSLLTTAILSLIHYFISIHVR